MSAKSGLRQMIKMAVQNVLLPPVYRLCCLRGQKKGLVVFADAHHDSRPENMDLLVRELERRRAAGHPLEIRELYLDYQSAPPLALLRAMLRFMRLYAAAQTVVICDNFLPAASCRKRRGTQVIQLWHACGALKKFGYDSPDDIPASYRGNVFRNTGLVTVSSEACRKPFASAMKLDISFVRALGVSRTDRFFDPAWREACREQAHLRHPQWREKKVVLWAPTFRGSAGDPELLSFDPEALEAELGGDFAVAACLHPHMKEGAERQVNTDRLFPAADVLIADYSSLIFEYLLFEKPLVLYVPDLEAYEKTRGFYMDYREIPGRIVTRREDLAAAVREEMETDRTESRRAFLKKYMESCDGHSTERIADCVERGMHQAMENGKEQR